MTQNTVRGDVLVTIAMLIFGSYALFIRFLPDIPVITFLFALQVVGFFGFLFLTSQQGFPKITRRLFWFFVALAVTTLLNDLSYFAAFRLTSVANAAIAHQMVSFFLILFAPLFLNEKTTKNEWIALAISITGLAIVFGGGIQLSHNDYLGIAAGLLSALCYALFTIMYIYLPQQNVKVHAKQQKLTISMINFWRFGLSTIFLLPAMTLFGNWNILSANAGNLILFGIMFAVIASGIHNLGMSRTRPLHASILGKSEPVIASLYAYLFLSEVPAMTTLIGGALIIGASTWLALRKEHI